MAVQRNVPTKSEGGAVASHWTAEHLAALACHSIPELATIAAAEAAPLLPHLHLWDMWPVQLADGATLRIAGWEVWVIMSAPRALHPDQRHDAARLRLATYREGAWQDCGDLLPPHLNPGSREWAGSTLYAPDSKCLTLFYTVTGRRGEAARTYEQRLFQTQGILEGEAPLLSASGWTIPVESVASDGDFYVVANQKSGVPGFIKAFRDPFYFRDSADERDYLLFTASLGRSTSAFNGAIGMARADGNDLSGWRLLPPLISADRVNNELERPLLRMHDGLYYVFWSTQSHTFAPGVSAGPNGLYGMVGASLMGPYTPLNGSGLVAANPRLEPFQCYSWWVMDSLEVVGFVDHWGLEGRSLRDNPGLAASQFGGTPAPRFRLALDGDRAVLLA